MVDPPPLPPERPSEPDPRVPVGQTALNLAAGLVVVILFVARPVGEIADGFLSTALNVAVVAGFGLEAASQLRNLLILRRAGVRIGRSRFPSSDVPKEVGRFLQPDELLILVISEAGRPRTDIPAAFVITDRRVLVVNCVPFTNEAYELAWDCPAIDARLDTVKKGWFFDQVHLTTPSATHRLNFRRRYAAPDRIRDALGNT